jgi:hypothetical protein
MSQPTLALTLFKVVCEYAAMQADELSVGEDDIIEVIQRGERVCYAQETWWNSVCLFMHSLCLPF